MEEDEDTVCLAVYNPCGQRQVELVTNTPVGREISLQAETRVAIWLKAAGLGVWRIYVKRTVSASVECIIVVTDDDAP